MGGAFNLAAPVLAVGTAAGTGIDNTATATYEDPNNPGTSINATSNKVTITVAEVAGLTVVESGIEDRNGGSASTNDIIDFKFTITNVGNDTTAVYIPGKTALNANNKIVGGNIGSTAGADNVYIVAINGQTLTSPVPVPAAGADTNNATLKAAIQAAGYSAFDGSVTAGNSILVKVPVTVTETVATQPISVQFGNTSDGTPNTQNRQNIPESNNTTTNTEDVRTVDIVETGNTSGAPINGEREAAASRSIALATSVKTRAFATVLETRAAYIPNGAALTDDQIRYRLDLRVESSAPAGSGFSPGTLEGTTLTNNITGTGAPAAGTPVILVSDVIPANTVLDYSSLPQAPSGWTVVYSNTDPTPTNANAINAQWTTTAPTSQTQADLVKRVGFIYTGTMAPGSSTVNDANGFQFQVKTSGLSATGGNILNITQAFGETQGDTSDTKVYDESGDQQPNNFNSDNTTPYPDGAGGFDPATDSGVALATYGSDPSSQTTNNASSNQGQGPDGEVNLITIAPIGSILNGPDNAPGATGSGNNNQADFVNKSINPPAGKNPAVALTDAETPNITFNNTVNNPNTTALNNVVLKPILASQADFVGGGTATDQTDTHTGYGIDTPTATLPTGTTVAIDPDGPTGPAVPAVYTWNDSSAPNTFKLTSGSPIRLATLGANTSVNYTVTVNLGAGAAQNAAFPVAIAAFVDESGTGTTGFNEFDRSSTNASAESVYNLTVDRVYTGFMKLTKQARLLNADGTAVTGADGQFSTTPAFKPQPDQIIEYQISYQNISTPASAGGTGSVLLNASNFNIFEDGKFVANVNGNNWADSTTHVMSKAIATLGNVKFYDAVINTSNPGAGVPEALSNSGYVNSVGSVAPAGTGNFTFQRKLK